MSHLFSDIYGGSPQREFKVGIAVPCFWKDMPFLQECLKSIYRLKIQPYITSIDVNYDSNVNEVRRLLFERLFNKFKCDVVLVADSDFYLLPNILKYVKLHRVVSFHSLCLKRYDVSLTLYQMLFPLMGWSGCYSIPIEVWDSFKDRFTDLDSGVWRAIGRFQYDYNLRFAYYALRPYRKSSVMKFVKNMTLSKRLLWRFLRMGIG